MIKPQLATKTQSYSTREIARIVNRELTEYWPKGEATAQDWIACHMGIKALCAVIGGLHLLHQTSHDRVLMELLEDLDLLLGIVAVRRTARARRDAPIAPQTSPGMEPQRLRQVALL